MNFIYENEIEYKGHKGQLIELKYMSPATGYQLVINVEGIIMRIPCVRVEDIKLI